jgi:hypothetical protein
MKLKKGFSKHVYIAKFHKFLVNIDKRLLKLDKIIKSIESMKTMDPLQDKSNMRSTTLLAKSNMRLPIHTDMGVIIPDPNTMKSNAMAS